MPSKSLIKRIQQDDDDFYSMYDGGDGEKKPRGKDKYKDDLDNAPPTPSFEGKNGGMNLDRSCNGDFVWGCIFVAFLGSMIFLTYLGYRDGDVAKLLAPVVTNGDQRQLCGYANTTEGYDNTGYGNLVITDWAVTGGVGAIFDSGVCVKECPTA